MSNITSGASGNTLCGRLNGKKLLVLGGLRTTFLIERAKKLGAYVIVADYDEDSPGKRLADEAVLIDALDVDELVRYGREKKIDGIITAHVDILMKPCLDVANQLGLPCCFTSDIIELSTNKEKFKNFCRKHQVLVPDGYTITVDDIPNLSDQIDYPLFVKPVDASGSRGATKCNNIGEFYNNVKLAAKYSNSGKVMVEECLSGTDFGVDYLIVNGEPFQISMHDRQICEGRPFAINHSNLQLLPSRYLNLYREKMHPYVCKMLRELDLKNGLCFFQGFIKDDSVKFFEMGCRLGSTWNYIDEYFLGVNPMDALISYSLTGQMFDSFVEFSPFFNGYGAVVNLLSDLPEGKIEKIIGMDKIASREDVVCIMAPYKEGDTFQLNRMTDITLLRCQIVSDTFDHLKDTIDYVYNHVDFLDEKGESLMSKVYCTSLLDY